MKETTSCRHIRTQLIAKDEDAEYVECLDCGALLEASELAKNPAEKQIDQNPAASESLSDA